MQCDLLAGSQLVKQTGEAFNELLRSGKHQELFTEF